MTRVLGISAFYHDSAAALITDGEITAAAQEERFSRLKHDSSFPSRAIDYCLEAGDVDDDGVDFIAFYEKPLKRFDRLLETYLATAPRGFGSFCVAVPQWIRHKLFIRRLIRRSLPQLSNARLIFIDHHESHAASAFFPSPFERAAILTLDGVGEWDTATFGTGVNNKIALSHHLRFPHSLGLLYSAFTHYCGFKVNSGEYKLMGLAPYGRPNYRKRILDHLVHLKPDGTFRLDMRYFHYHDGLRMTTPAFDDLFEGPPRTGQQSIEQKHADLAASIQSVCEEIILRLARTVHDQTQMDDLVLAGGVALNCVANRRLLDEGPFRRIWIQPAAGDAGGSLGAALFVWHQLLDQPRRPDPVDSQRGSFLGPAAPSRVIARMLTTRHASYTRASDQADLVTRVASELADGKVVGWFQGRMEFGPRALGARSILADPRVPDMQSTLNLKIKFRESFRPFAPAVLQEFAKDFFDIQPGHSSPYMLLIANVRESHRTLLADEDVRTMHDDPDLFRRVNVVRSSIPAVTHIDYSARVQTVDAVRNPLFHALLTEFHKLTGCPMLVNTSFNVRGEPIVCTPQDAFDCFAATDLDLLVLENFIIEKSALPEVSKSDRAAHLAQFQLD